MTQAHDEPDGRCEPTTGRLRKKGEVRRTTSAKLFAGDRELLIEHEGSVYRLRRTSKGKLILTK